MGVPAMPVVENFALMEMFETCASHMSMNDSASAGNAGSCFASSEAPHLHVSVRAALDQALAQPWSGIDRLCEMATVIMEDGLKHARRCWRGGRRRQPR